MKKSNNIEFIEKSNKIHKHGVFEQISGTHLYNKCGCPKCQNNYRPNNQEFIKKSKETHNNNYDYSLVDYINSEVKVKIICSKHGIFEQKPCKHLKSQGCPKCAKNVKLTIDDIVNRSNIIHNYKYLILDQEYINNRTKLTITCKTCNKTFSQSVDDHLRGKIGCDCYIKSKGEIAISKFLFNQNISFETQKRFNNCRNTLTLPFDFYLSTYNIAIEFDGRQHFNINTKFYTPEIEKNDKIKTNYCINNNINLLRIKYDKNIEEKIKKYLYEKI